MRWKLFGYEIELRRETEEEAVARTFGWTAATTREVQRQMAEWRLANPNAPEMTILEWVEGLWAEKWFNSSYGNGRRASERAE